MEKENAAQKNINMRRARASSSAALADAPSMGPSGERAKYQAIVKTKVSVYHSVVSNHTCVSGFGESVCVSMQV
jgi:hypothetical protein